MQPTRRDWISRLTQLTKVPLSARRLSKVCREPRRRRAASQEPAPPPANNKHLPRRASKDSRAQQRPQPPAQSAERKPRRQEQLSSKALLPAGYKRNKPAHNRKQRKRSAELQGPRLEHSRHRRDLRAISKPNKPLSRWQHQVPKVAPKRR